MNPDERVSLEFWKGFAAGAAVVAIIGMVAWLLFLL